ncbi:MAG: hypothetical protein GY707_05700 [Desulfobacteraceae bacterium]|nr:hypothetical protein [Desulfobacteraceae bacterium]
MKFHDRNTNTDYLKFNAKTGWISISEEKDHGFSRKKVGMFLSPEDVDAITRELAKYKVRLT